MAVWIVYPSLSCSCIFSKYPFTSRIGGVDEALDDDVIDDGAGGWCNGNDVLLIAVAVAVFVFDEIVDDDEELLPLSDAEVWSSIMQLTTNVVEMLP